MSVALYDGIEDVIETISEMDIKDPADVQKVADDAIDKLRALQDRWLVMHEPEA